ncbi:T9SS type A sorting domain-containing protein [Hymenobacter sp. H14-R3]|uniref:T9SS type A sorting domain-containing protein n=1 Tax=Hymenobacter sp. H14-R3 TaxID=3046308 RepID=UPI0024B96AFE|nr:T9SS type A sorting domain-containing protein [Hymenobacter sp. H14-R3]MDJ0366588.1 T9SS type A sorting domain-containing protein [Hymenobacter sp. H14-R3]
MQSISSFLQRLGLLSAAVGLLSSATAAAQTPKAFTAGNYVVARVGDGTAALTSAATATFLLEYTAAGTLVQTIALPVADATPNLALTETGTSGTDAALTRSADGRYLVLTGYNAVPGAAALANTPAATTNRLIGRIAADGTLNTTTRITDAFSGTASSGANIRGAASANGSAFYAVGNAGGVVYVPLANVAASKSISTGSPTSDRAVGIFGGNLYVSSGSAPTYGVVQVGTGLPTTSGQAQTLLAGFPTVSASSASSCAFLLTDQSATVPGLDVLYVADDGGGSAAGGIQKWSLVGSTWVLNGTITATATVRGLAGSLSGTTVSLMASSTSSLYTATDNAGYNVAPSTAALPAAVATAGTNAAFRGVALAPVATALATRLEATQGQLALYPNPAQNMLTISLATGPAAGHLAEVRDLLGRSVHTATLPASGQLSLAGLPAGSYLLTVDGSLTRRINKVD